jgi:hypothetical protein
MYLDQSPAKPGHLLGETWQPLVAQTRGLEEVLQGQRHHNPIEHGVSIDRYFVWITNHFSPFPFLHPFHTFFLSSSSLPLHPHHLGTREAAQTITQRDVRAATALRERGRQQQQQRDLQWQQQ